MKLNAMIIPFAFQCIYFTFNLYSRIKLNRHKLTQNIIIKTTKEQQINLNKYFEYKTIITIQKNTLQ